MQRSHLCHLLSATIIKTSIKELKLAAKIKIAGKNKKTKETRVKQVSMLNHSRTIMMEHVKPIKAEHFELSHRDLYSNSIISAYSLSFLTYPACYTAPLKNTVTALLEYIKVFKGPLMAPFRLGPGYPPWAALSVYFRAIQMHAILGELCWLEFFKTIYLETSNV